MMATEAPINKVADVSESSEFSLAEKHHNVVSEDATVNGRPSVGNDEIANKRITNLEEHTNSTEVSVSGGSDTEASRTDWARAKDGDKGHFRNASSAKKPATFKAVSVNKTFLASKTTSPSTSTSKTSDKPSSGSSTPPPGSNALSASRPRLVAKTASAARDAAPRFSSAVNGGKPASVPDPSAVWNKNRPPEPKKFTDEELKKYGIHMASRLNEDDTQGQSKWADIDDDDDDWAPEAITWGDGTKTTLPHLDDQTTAPSDNGDCASVGSKTKSQDKSKSPAPPTSLTGSPLTRPISLGSGKGLILKGATVERPALIAKPAVPPGPSKSPWAQLPPVDKASPNSAEPVGLGRCSTRDESLYKNTNIQPREIAADDFSRSSWRDVSTHGPKELYNSHSGRYEPVSDRRGMARLDVQAKPQLALLQRGQPSDKPAEPSNAFQTNHVSQNPTMERRRGSSNISGGSGSYLMRMGKAHDGTLHSPAEAADSPKSVLAASGVVPQAPPGNTESRSSTKSSAVERQTAPGHEMSSAEEKSMAASEPLVDEVEFQKKVMQEKRELARKRREEEEAREKAARMERIQKKLDAMGPPPSKKSDKKDSSLAHESTKATQMKQREQAEPSREVTGKWVGAEANYSIVNAAKPRQNVVTETKPPVGRDGSYVEPAGRRPSQGGEAKRMDNWAGGVNRSEKLSPWAAGVSSQSRNVWGSPDNDRGLGNGTFNPDLGRISGSSVAAPSQSRKGPLPIAPPTAAARTASQGQARPQSPIGPQSSRFAASGTDLASKWAVSIPEKDKKMAAEKLAERAERERQLIEKGLSTEDAQPAIKDTWRQVHLAGDGTRRVLANTQLHTPSVAPWKTAQEKLTKDSAPVEASMPLTNAGVIGSGPSSSVLPQSGKGQPRASRFFPAKDVRFESMAPAAEPSRPESPCPPPPTMEGHPAYEGDAIHPHVSLPKPQPVVKLPPVKWTPTLSHSQLRFDGAELSRAELSHLSSRDSAHGTANTSHHVKDERYRASWQDRINNLLNGNKPLPMKHMDVNPASRSSLDHGVQQNMATVSLPGVVAADVPGSQRSPVSKPMAEDCFEEQEMGSLPQIRLPHKAPEAAWQPAPAPTRLLPKKFLVQASIMEPYSFAADVVGGGNAIKIQLPGMTEARVVTIPFSATRGGRAAQGRPAPRHRGPGHGPRVSRRESSNGNGYGGRDNGSSSSSRGGRSGYRRASSESWSRQVSGQASASCKVQQAS